MRDDVDWQFAIRTTCKFETYGKFTRVSRVNYLAAKCYSQTFLHRNANDCVRAQRQRLEEILLQHRIALKMSLNCLSQQVASHPESLHAKVTMHIIADAFNILVCLYNRMGSLHRLRRHRHFRRVPLFRKEVDTDKRLESLCASFFSAVGGHRYLPYSLRDAHENLLKLRQQIVKQNYKNSLALHISCMHKITLERAQSLPSQNQPAQHFPRQTPRHE